MPQLSPGQPIRSIPASVILDGSGNGTVFFQATGSAARITNLFGKVTTSTNQATATVYLGTIADTNAVFNSNSGSTGFTATGQIDIPDGTILYVVWTGGDAGATAKATFSGVAIPFDQISGGFEMRADDPIAAGDGSLIFPALKSPNYVTGNTGWKIDRQGDVEFNDAVIRGTVDIAGGVVTIDNTGIVVEGSGHRYSMNITGGVRGRLVPDDGAYVTLQDNALFVAPLDPFNGFATDAGYVAGREVISGASFVWTEIRSPEINGQDNGRIRVWGASSGGTSPPVVDLGTSTTPLNIVRLDPTTDIEGWNGDDRYGRGKWNLVTASGDASLTTTPSVAFTLPSATYKANRAYEAIMDARYVNGNNPATELRKGTTTGGTLVVNAGRVPANIGSTLSFRTTMIFIVGGSDVTTQLNITMTSQATTTQSGPRRVLINDIGPASDYSDYSANTLS